MVVVLRPLLVGESGSQLLSSKRRRSCSGIRASSRCCCSAASSYHSKNGLLHLFQKPKPPARSASASPTTGEEEEFHVVAALNTQYNDIVIVDTPKSRMLLLDSSHNVHSIFNKGEEEEGRWTGSYWDEFASLPAIVPAGPIAILGLGGGTCAHLILDLWPALKLEGWEIDQILIDKSREHLGLSQLEKCTQAGGFLGIHVGDALSPSVSVPGGFAGIVVDLFSDGKVLPQLQEVATWLELNNKLTMGGRIMVNCGGADTMTTEVRERIVHNSSSRDDLWVYNSTIKAMNIAFPESLSWKKMGGKDGENYLALTGPFPDLDAWSALVPEKLSFNVKQWRRPCRLVSP